MLTSTLVSPSLTAAAAEPSVHDVDFMETMREGAANEYLAYSEYPKIDYHNAGLGGCNRHHLLFFARIWNVGTGKTLRELPYFSYYLPAKELHDPLHALMFSGIEFPESGGHIVAAAYRFVTRGLEEGWLSSTDSLPARLTLLMWLFADSPETVQGLRRQLYIVTSFDAEHQLVG